ncbi:Uu.00g141110.m01.CDS01 [Anthostomella pinea]|uniref:Uu.00g141110.m01.CDS01 n=1 Tax=Anthostomella pinea TaxID=933095 RepID=A0AAI8VJS2_9PEZI|nr:Uu.00g141110.m01.CDS01 [Anthostomella pinea]
MDDTLVNTAAYHVRDQDNHDIATGSRAGPAESRHGPFTRSVESQQKERAQERGVRLKKDFLDILYDFRHRESLDPGDKIYAMIRLAEGRKMERIEVDFSLSTEDVHDGVKKVIQQSYPGLDLYVAI